MINEINKLEAVNNTQVKIIELQRQLIGVLKSDLINLTNKNKLLQELVKNLESQINIRS